MRPGRCIHDGCDALALSVDNNGTIEWATSLATPIDHKHTTEPDLPPIQWRARAIDTSA